MHPKQPTPSSQNQEQTPEKLNQKPQIVVRSMRKNRKWPIALLVIIVASLVGGGIKWMDNSPSKKTTHPSQAAQATETANIPGLQLDPLKNYGDKYVSGIVPVGDKKYSSTEAKKGYVYTCEGYTRNISQTQNGGAGRRGPWFSSDGAAYDLGKKLHVNGNVSWQSSLTNAINDNQRNITTNGLPNHITGLFPIAANDPAYAYDKNPNKIKSLAKTYNLNTKPAYGEPQCMGGQAGIMLTGVAIFNAFDAEGRDGGAWEVQDNCGGHPEKEGLYHYHTLSSCIKDTNVQTVIGFALDGFPITGPNLGTGNILTTSDLDECHGITSTINLDGSQVTTYHYAMTQDFPYSVSCFRSTPIQTNPTPSPRPQ